MTQRYSAAALQQNTAFKKKIFCRPREIYQSVEKLTGAHTEGEIKVLVELFQKLAGS